MSNRRGFIGGLLGLLGIGAASQASAGVATTPKLVELKGEALTTIKDLHRIRIWKLGNLEHKIFPTEAAVKKLSDLLYQWGGKGPLDLIWGPDLTLEEHWVSEDDLNFITGNPQLRIVKPDSEGILKVEDPDKIMEEIDKKLDNLR